MQLQISASDIISLIALILAGYTTFKTIAFNKKQQELDERTDMLNKLLIRKENKEAISEFRADISANFIKIGSNNHRLKIVNKGKGTAKNVRIKCVENHGCLIESDIDRKFPIQIFESFQHVELIASSALNSNDTLVIELIWDDETGKDNSKILTPVLS